MAPAFALSPVFQ